MDQYLHFDSHQPVSHKLSVIGTLNYRAQTAVRDLEERTKELDHIKGALSRCGYRQWAFDLADSQSNTSADKKTCPRSDQPGPSKKSTTFCTLLFVDGLSQNPERVFKSYGVATFFRPHTALRKLLFATKDPVPIDKRSGCVCKLSCQQCTATYIGQIGRQLGQRMKEHKSSVSSRIPFAVKEHSTEEAHHTIDWENIKILEGEDREFPHQVKEAPKLENTYRRSTGTKN